MCSWCGTRGTPPSRSPGFASRTPGRWPARSTGHSSSRWCTVSRRREDGLMLTRALTAFVLAATPQVPTPTCKLAGPPVEARWSGTIPPASTAEAPLRVVADVPLPGSASRFDYQSLEPASGRLFISHMGAGQVVVFDVRAGRVIANLDGFPTVTGVLAVPVEHRAYRPSGHSRQRGPVPARFLHRRTAPSGVHLRPGERHAGRAGSPDPSATSGAANRQRS